MFDNRARLALIASYKSDKVRANRAQDLQALRICQVYLDAMGANR